MEHPQELLKIAHVQFVNFCVCMYMLCHMHDHDIVCVITNLIQTTYNSTTLLVHSKLNVQTKLKFSVRPPLLCIPQRYSSVMITRAPTSRYHIWVVILILDPVME